MANLKHGDLKVWWMPQVLMDSFEVCVDDLEQAALLLSVLADYDDFQSEHNIKPGYCNVGGLVEYDSTTGAWHDWVNEDGDDFYYVHRDPILMADAISKAQKAKVET